MEGLSFITLRDKPALKEAAAEWFHSKWSVPKEAYLECMDSYLKMKQNMDGICAWTEIRSSVGWALLKMTFTIEKI